MSNSLGFFLGGEVLVIHHKNSQIDNYICLYLAFKCMLCVYIYFFSLLSLNL